MIKLICDELCKSGCLLLFTHVSYVFTMSMTAVKDP